MSALYKSEKWLRREYLTKKKSPEQIAEETGATRQTIYRYIKQFRLKR